MSNDVFMPELLLRIHYRKLSYRRKIERQRDSHQLKSLFPTFSHFAVQPFYPSLPASHLTHLLLERIVAASQSLNRMKRDASDMASQMEFQMRETGEDFCVQ